MKSVCEKTAVLQERNAGNTPKASYTCCSDLSGTLEGAGGIGGLLARSDGYVSGSFTNHDYYQGDGNGNITRMIDANQTVVATYKYDPFGNTLSQSGDLADTNVYQFSSKERMQIYLAHVGTLYYYGYRFYSPHFQRWLNRDPIEEWGGLNLYAFVRNNPISGVDPFGESVLDDLNDPNSKYKLDEYQKDQCPKKKKPCPPCNPPVGTVGYVLHNVPPHKPHNPFQSHVHLFKMNQNPDNCDCFWNRAGVASTPPPLGAVKLPGSD